MLSQSGTEYRHAHYCYVQYVYMMYAWGQSTGLVTENLMKVISSSPKRRNLSIWSVAESSYSCGFPATSVFALDPVPSICHRGSCETPYVKDMLS